jgi:hypothetical protein
MKIKIRFGQIDFRKILPRFEDIESDNTFYILIGWTRVYEVFPNNAKRYFIGIGRLNKDHKIGEMVTFSKLMKTSKIYFDIRTLIRQKLEDWHY